MPTPQESAAAFVALWVTPGTPYGGARPGRAAIMQSPGETFSASAAFATSSLALDLAQPNPGSVGRGFSVFDLTTGEPIGTVWNWPQGSAACTLMGAAQNASAGASDTLLFYDAAGSASDAAKFPGALQAAFFAAGYGPGDLAAGLAYAVNAGWLTQGQRLAGTTRYTLEQAGFAEASGTAPTQAASGQQLVNVAVAQGGAALSGRFSLSAISAFFVGTAGDNTFEPEDLIGGYGFAFSQGWVRPAGQYLFDPTFVLTAAGVAAAS